MKKYILVAAICATAMGICNAYSQNTDKDTIFFNPNPESKYDSLVNLESVVISANHMAVSRRNAPQMVGVISQKTIQMTPNVCAADILSYQSGVRVENNCSSCGYKQARINGLDGHYSMIMINSRPVLSSVSNLYGLEQIPSAIIERTEVMRGGGSALYGASAVGGTINIITKEPTENFSQISHTVTSLGMSKSLDNYTSFVTSFVGSDKKSGISLFGSDRQRDGYSYYDDGMTTLPKLNVMSMGTKFFFKTSDFSKLDIFYNLMKDERRGGNKLSMPVEQANIAETSGHLLHNLTADYHFNTEDNRFHGDLFAALAAVNRNSYAGGYIDDDDPDIDAWKYHSKTRDITFNGGGMLRYRFDKLFFMPAYLTLGAEYAGDFLKDKALGYQITERQNTHTESIYLQNEWTNRKWNILLGLRADKHNLISNTILSPRLSMKYSALANLDLRFTYSEGFRAPQIFDEDLHVSMSNGERFRIRLAKGLKEEKSRSFSLSADWYINVKKLKMNFMCEGFFTSLDNVFAQRQTDMTDAQGNNIIERYNASGAKYYGISCEWKTKYYDICSADLGFTLQKSHYNQEEEWSEEATGTKRVLRTPDSYGYFTFEYSKIKNLDIDITGTYTGSMLCPHFVSSGTDKDVLKETPAFFDVNLKAVYSFNLTQQTVMSLSLGIINLFDSFQKDLDKGVERDSDYIYGPSLNRSLTFGVSIKF